jgi:hypothetical protein
VAKRVLIYPAYLIGLIEPRAAAHVFPGLAAEKDIVIYNSEAVRRFGHQPTSYVTLLGATA